MLSAGLLVASLLYWGSNSDAPAKTMISPAKIIGGRQRKCQQHPMLLNDFFRTLSHKTYSYSSPNSREYPCCLFSVPVTTATGQRRQEPMLGTRQEIAQGSIFHGIKSSIWLWMTSQKGSWASLGLADVTAQQFDYFCVLTEPFLSAIHVPVAAPQRVYWRRRQEG